MVLGAMVSLVESDVAHAERRLLEAALYDGLEVRRTGCAIWPTDWKSVVRAVRLHAVKTLTSSRL